MNDKPVIDPARDRAFRAMIVENARAGSARPSLRGRASLLIGLVVAALLVSGGGVALAVTGVLPGPVSAPAPVETATVTPTPTPTPTPTTVPAPPPEREPTPTPTAADVGSWTLGFDGVGPIAFGGTTASATAALDTTDLVPFDFGVEECRADYRQLPGNDRSFVGVDSDEAGAVDGIEVADYPSDEGVQLGGALPRTAEGVSTGSTREELLTAYPDLVEEAPVAGDGLYSLAGPDGRTLWFRVASATETVAAITLTAFSDYTIGGCGA